MPTDEILIAVYLELKIPADQLVLHRELGDRYIAAVEQKAAEPVDRERTLCKLITLRKTGRLPRLRRKRS